MFMKKTLIVFAAIIVLFAIPLLTNVNNYTYFDDYDWSGQSIREFPGIAGWVIKFPRTRHEYLLMEPELFIRSEDMVDRIIFSDEPYLGDISNWIVHNHSRWHIVTDKDDLRWGIITSKYLNLSGGRLGEYAIINNKTYADFIFNASVKITDNMERNPSCDYDVIFGYQSPINYYYMMFSSNEHNTDLFRINNGEREYVAQTEYFPVPDNKYHNISIIRIKNNIKVYFDNEKILETWDGRFGAGKIGIGSFNDMSLWHDINIIELHKADTDLDMCIETIELIRILKSSDDYTENEISEAISLWMTGMNC